MASNITLNPCKQLVLYEGAMDELTRSVAKSAHNLDALRRQALDALDKCPDNVKWLDILSHIIRLQRKNEDVCNMLYDMDRLLEEERNHQMELKKMILKEAN